LNQASGSRSEITDSFVRRERTWLDLARSTHAAPTCASTLTNASSQTRWTSHHA
jgi:hypothetical protein